MLEKIRKYPLLVAIIALAIGFCGIQYLPYDGDSVMQMTLVRVLLSAILIGIMILMGSKKIFANVKDGFGFSLRSCIYFLIIAALPGIISIITAITKNNIPDNWLMSELSYFILALSVGIFEEGLFRGIVLNSTLRKTGKTRKGIWAAIIISSFIFGVFHVVGYIFGGSYDLIGILQTIGKILQTGIFGVLLCALFLKTRNFWGIALAHALNDFLAFQALIFGQNASVGNYVKSGDAGVTSLIMYAVMLVLYIPVLIKAIKTMKQVNEPEYGVFKEK